MKGGDFVYRLKALFVALCVSLFGLVSSAMAFDTSTLSATFTGASSDLEAFALVVFGPLCTVWVIRKFIRLLNGS